MKTNTKSFTFITDLEKVQNTNSDKAIDTEDVDQAGKTGRYGETKTTFATMNKSTAQFYKDHVTEFNKTRDDFLAYIINDQTKFADFNKIDNYYKSSIVEYVTKLNKQNIILNEKRAKLKLLDEAISSVSIFCYSLFIYLKESVM